MRMSALVLHFLGVPGILGHTVTKSAFCGGLRELIISYFNWILDCY